MLKLERNVRKLAPLGAALLLSAFGATAAMAQDQAAPAAPAGPTALSTPSFAGPLAANANPLSFDTTDLLGDAGGKIYITGAVTGLAYWQSNPTFGAPGDVSSYMDLANAQVEIQKTDGWLQFYVQAGDYSLPTLGAPYAKSSFATPGNFGVVPVAYLKLQGEGDLADFSIEGGKLPTLIGDEYLFTYENMNIERGLLWNIEPAVSRGIQVNYSNGPLTISLSGNDGFYTNKINWFDGLLSYAITPADTVAFSGGANLGGHNGSLLNRGGDYTLIWTHTDGSWVFSPYVQLNTTPSITFGTVKVYKSTNDWSGAILTSWSFDDNWKVAGRAEYETSSGNTSATLPLTPPVGGFFGPGSAAYSLTITPSYQWKLFFARLDLSYTATSSGVNGYQFGTKFNSSNQTRLMFETGVLF
jgi:hypothetical protein